MESYINREIKEKFLQMLRFFPCVVCTGSRQVGKTTMIRHLLKDYNYVSLDLPSIATMAEETPDLFFEKYAPPIIIDEVQKAPGIFQYLKTIIDENRHSMGQFVLTGSQRFNLMSNISESLAGRVGIFELEGLSYSEANAFSNISVEDFMIRGTYPELFREKDFPPDFFFSSYIATYLERDVRQLLKVGNLRDFEKLIRLLALQSGNLMDMSSIANSVGIAVSTVKNWISVLETSGIITLLAPWFSNEGKRLVKTPKIYFNDAGLLCWLLGITRENFIESVHNGAVWETFVFSELRKNLELKTKGEKLYFYRDKNGIEVDFLLESSEITLIECKLTDFPKKKDTENLSSVSESFFPNAKKFVISRTENEFLISGTNIFAENIETIRGRI